jgi:MFS transporter, FSR family, fosmidomycin resistance protein
VLLPFLVSLLHTTNDLFGAFLTPLLPRLQTFFGVNYASVSLLVAVYSLTSSLLQPVAGLIADRYDRRMLAALGPLLVALGCGLMGYMPNPFILAVLLGVSGLGSALFHSAGAALVGQYAPKERKGFWLSFFGSSGYVGLTLGPIVSLGIVSSARAVDGTGLASAVGLQRLAWLIPLALIPAIFLLRQAPPTKLKTKPSTFRDLARVFRGQVARLWAMATLRNIAFMSFSTTIPYWFAQRGIPETLAPGTPWWFLTTTLALTVYNIAATAGAFLGGTLSDRFGRRTVLVSTMVFAIPLYIGLLLVPPETAWLYLPLLALTGALMNAGIPVAVVMAQEHEPTQIATVSGLLMGFTWGFAGLFYGIIGPLVERFGVIPTMTALGLLLIPALIVTLSVKDAKDMPQNQSVRVPSQVAAD